MDRVLTADIQLLINEVSKYRQCKSGDLIGVFGDAERLVTAIAEAKLQHLISCSLRDSGVYYSLTKQGKSIIKN